ncbi:helicase [Emiliania huxleyi CCMP1516]|uniref:Uncharacterized protein n=2 Tax=Emiliania huxleyi TaxID=2903 RepID=A0A0D3L0U8_EMIH1|nr:helicase [Emiliania huxleyi CCMP1516]EOD41633.1 helicase [Emiliania huxleyi CCMP1516]|eukprot:XP_005794062.1 helicase [Emiliania huxleyi CCMP1516]
MRSPAAACLPHSILLLSASFARPLRVAPPSPRASVRCSAASFAELGLRAETIDALDRLGVVAPNELQARAMPALAGRGDLIVGAQTGSGKTLTYLVPIMQTLKADEEAAGARAKPKRPRALVLVPTRELAVQVHEVGRTLGQSLRLSVKAVSGGTPVAPQARMLSLPVDVLVATPGRLLQLVDKGSLFLGDVRHVIVDEVDTMFEAGFGDELDKLLAITTRNLAADPRAAAAAAAGRAAARVQHVAVGATHPAAAVALYERRLSGAKQMMVGGVHTVPAQLEQRFVTCKGPDGKVAALRELLGPPLGPPEEGRPTLGRVVLFCNSQDSARFVDRHLEEEGYATANYHGAIPAKARADNFERFVAGGASPLDAERASVLVTTDLAARGLDNLQVEHVVQFDFPKSAADYLHRCGRTARAGSRGASHSLVTK